VSGLDLVAWTAARNDTQLTDTITKDEQAAVKAGLRSTPSFRIGKTGNPPYASAIRETLGKG
jgi:protein-disulfide isomerase